MTRQRDGNYLWVTWLSRLMSGEVKCQWAPWFRTHFSDYQRAPSDFQAAQWQAEHTQLLSELLRERERLGEATYKEDQNSFRIKMTPTLVLAGKPDLVSIGSSGEGTVYDAKTGRPRQSDLIQVMLYMLCLPSALMVHKGRKVAGCVVYKSGERSQIPADGITEEFKKSARYFVQLLDAAEPPGWTPSPQECRYCDITEADCPERLAPMESGTEQEEPPSLDWGDTEAESPS